MREAQQERDEPSQLPSRPEDARAVILLCVMALIAIGLVRPAGASAVPDTLRACAQEPDDHKRLACYDQEIARLSAKADRSIGLTKAQERKEDETEAQRAVRSSQPASAPVLAPKPVSTSTRQGPLESAAVASISRRGDGRCVITLDNGQVWLQGEAYESFEAKTGEAITIRSGLLGSFYMHTASGADTRVTRQR